MKHPLKIDGFIKQSVSNDYRSLYTEWGGALSTSYSGYLEIYQYFLLLRATQMRGFTTPHGQMNTHKQHLSPSTHAHIHKSTPLFQHTNQHLHQTQTLMVWTHLTVPTNSTGNTVKTEIGKK